VHGPKNARAGASVERDENGHTIHPFVSVPEQEIQEDHYKQARDQGRRDPANRGARVIEQIAARRFHSIKELCPNCFFVNGQVVDNNPQAGL
jgi:hypothetical protein